MSFGRKCSPTSRVVQVVLKNHQAEIVELLAKECEVSRSLLMRHLVALLDNMTIKDAVLRSINPQPKLIQTDEIAEAA